MFRESLPIVGRGGDFGPLIRSICIGALLLAELLIGQAAARAQAEPYCPPVSKQARELYDINKWCAAVNEDLRQGRTPNLGKRLEESWREPAEAVSSPTARPRSTPKDSVATVKPSKPANEAVNEVAGEEPRRQRRAVEETGRLPHSVSERFDDSDGNSRQEKGRKGDVHSGKPAATLTPEAPAMPSTPPLSSPAPSGSNNRSAPPAQTLLTGQDAERESAASSRGVTPPLGAALLFGFVVMLLCAVLIGRRRSRSEPAVAVAGPSDGLAAGHQCEGEIDGTAGAIHRDLRPLKRLWLTGSV